MLQCCIESLRHHRSRSCDRGPLTKAGLLLDVANEMMAASWRRYTRASGKSPCASRRWPGHHNFWTRQDGVLETTPMLVVTPAANKTIGQGVQESSRCAFRDMVAQEKGRPDRTTKC